MLCALSYPDRKAYECLCRSAAIYGYTYIIPDNQEKVEGENDPTMKAMDMEREYFICNLTACIMAFAADVAAYLLFHDLKAIAAASVAVYALWYVMCDMRIKQRLNEDTKRKI